MTTAKDAKESMDLSNAMQTQLALLNADKLKLEIQNAANENNRRLIEQKEHDNEMKVMWKDFNGKLPYKDGNKNLRSSSNEN